MCKYSVTVVVLMLSPFWELSLIFTLQVLQSYFFGSCSHHLLCISLCISLLTILFWFLFFITYVPHLLSYIFPSSNLLCISLCISLLTILVFGFYFLGWVTTMFATPALVYFSIIQLSYIKTMSFLVSLLQP